MKSIIFIILLLSIDVYTQSAIRMDGFFDDWNSGVITHIDDTLDSQGVDLLDFSVCNDYEYLYLRIRLSEEIDLTETFYNPAEIYINIDTDNNSLTGYYTNNIGSEYGINFFDKFIFDDTNYPSVDTLSLYDLDVIPLPTYSSNEFEIAIDRSLFSDTICISIKENIGNDFMPNNGSVFTYVFDNNFIPFFPVTDFLKNDSMYLRLMTYNVWSNGLISNNRIDEHRRIFASANADIITYQECGNTTYNDVLAFLNTVPGNYPYIYPDLNSGNLTISKYPSLQSWQVAAKIDAELIDLPDSIYSKDILIINGHPPCCGNNQGRQEHFDALIQFINDAKTIGGVIDLPINTPISFSGDMNLVGYSEQYYTILNGTISDTSTYGVGGLPDWNNTPLKDQVAYFNEKNMAYTWDNPNSANYPPGRLDFVFFSNSVMSVDKSFIISTEHMGTTLLNQNNLQLNDTKFASDHFPIVVDFIIPMVNSIAGCIDPGACNYNPVAVIDDSSCVYSVLWQQALTICAGDSIAIGNSIYDTSGIFIDTVLYTGSCDTIFYSTLSLENNVASFDTLSTNNAILWNTMYLDSSGDYLYTLVNVNGCDSVAYLNLTVNLSNIQEFNKNKNKLVKVVDYLGKEVLFKTKNKPLFYIFDDGTIKKKIIIEK